MNKDQLEQIRQALSTARANLKTATNYITDENYLGAQTNIDDTVATIKTLQMTFCQFSIDFDDLT